METISTGTVTMQGISSPAVAAYKNSGDVEFDVKYPKDYKGEKYMPEGVVTISKESAAQFTKLGIGQVVEAKEAETKPEGKKIK